MHELHVFLGLPARTVPSERQERLKESWHWCRKGHASPWQVLSGDREMHAADATLRVSSSCGGARGETRGCPARPGWPSCRGASCVTAESAQFPSKSSRRAFGSIDHTYVEYSGCCSCSRAPQRMRSIFLWWYCGTHHHEEPVLDGRDFRSAIGALSRSIIRGQPTHSCARRICIYVV